MPTVPRLNPTPVPTAPLPGNRVPTNVPARVFGTPEQVPLEGVARELTGIIQRHQAHADNVILLDADNQLAKLETDVRTQATSRRGKDALGATDQARDGWAKGVSQIEGSLTNDRQRELFRARVGNRFEGLYNAVETHAHDEWQRFQDTTAETAVKNRFNDALANYRDPQLVAKAAVEARAIVQDQAKRNGWTPEITDQKIADVLSSIHSGVVSRFLATGDDLAAKAYYDKSKSQITGKDAETLDKALEEGSTRGESQRQADAIVVKTKDRGAALEAAKSIADPKVRDMVEQRVNQHFSEQKAIEMEQREQLYLSATNQIDAAGAHGKGARDVVPPAVWAKLTLSEREALERRASDPTNDDKAWLTFLAMPVTDVGKLTRAQFETQYWSRFDKEHRSRAETQWNAAVDAVKNGRFDNPKLVSTISFKERLDNGIKQAGMIDASKEPSKYTKVEATLHARLEDETARQIEEFELTQLGGKRPATGAEQQKIIDSVLLQHVFVKGRAYGQDQKHPYQVETGERQRAFVPTDEIPIGERNRIAQVMRDRRSRVTTSKMERAYAAVLIGDRTLFDQILTEP